MGEGAPHTFSVLLLKQNHNKYIKCTKQFESLLSFNGVEFIRLCVEKRG